MRKSLALFLIAVFMVVFSAGMAMAASSVSWISPDNNSTYCIGTIVKPTGQASGGPSTGGTGLDLMFVIDRSGSMSTTFAGITRLQYAKTATNSLINTLPAATTQAGLASFSSSATLNQQLLPLVPAANITTLTNAVNALSASGNTAIGSGIQVATTELTNIRADANHTKMQVVLSDGENNRGINPVTAATNAWAAGITVHTVGVPGHSVATMSAIAAAGHGTYTNVANLDDLEDIFNGTDGNLVQLDHLDIELPNGTDLLNYPTDGLGNFILPNWSMLAGNNIFTATAFGTDGTSASAQLNLIGQVCPTPIPGSLLLLGSSLLGLVGLRKKLLG